MRCIRAVKTLRVAEGTDLRCIALYTEVDRDAPFVRHADEAIQLVPTGATAVSAYLDHDGLIDALQRCRADAVWPGWGFVAEDAEFVDRVTAAGIRFLGPSAAVMRAVASSLPRGRPRGRVDRQCQAVAAPLFSREIGPRDGGTCPGGGRGCRGQRCRRTRERQTGIGPRRGNAARSDARTGTRIPSVPRR